MSTLLQNLPPRSTTYCLLFSAISRWLQYCILINTCNTWACVKTPYTNFLCYHSIGSEIFLGVISQIPSQIFKALFSTKLRKITNVYRIEKSHISYNADPENNFWFLVRNYKKLITVQRRKKKGEKTEETN